MSSEYTLSILVSNAPGVLSKIAGLFYRAGHNIETLTVGKTAESGISKIVISVPSERAIALKLRDQLADMMDVKQAEVLDRSRSLMQEVCLIRVGFSTPKERLAIMAEAQPYRPQIRSVDDRSLVLEVADVPGMLDDFVGRMDEHEVLDVSRTGMTAIGPALPHTEG